MYVMQRCIIFLLWLFWISTWYQMESTSGSDSFNVPRGTYEHSFLSTTQDCSLIPERNVVISLLSVLMLWLDSPCMLHLEYWFLSFDQESNRNNIYSSMTSEINSDLRWTRIPQPCFCTAQHASVSFWFIVKWSNLIWLDSGISSKSQFECSTWNISPCVLCTS